MDGAAGLLWPGRAESLRRATGGVGRIRADRGEIKPCQGAAWGLSTGPYQRSLAATYNNSLIVYETARFCSQIDSSRSFQLSFHGTFGASANPFVVPDDQELTVRPVQPRPPRGGLPETSGHSNQSVLQSGWLRAPGGRTKFGGRIIHLNVEREKVSLQGHQIRGALVEFSPTETACVHGKRIAPCASGLSCPYESKIWVLLGPGTIPCVHTQGRFFGVRLLQHG